MLTSDHDDYYVEVRPFNKGLFIESGNNISDSCRALGDTIIVPPRLLEQFLKDIEDACSTI